MTILPFGRLYLLRYPHPRRGFRCIFGFAGGIRFCCLRYRMPAGAAMVECDIEREVTCDEGATTLASWLAWRVRRPTLVTGGNQRMVSDGKGFGG